MTPGQTRPELDAVSVCVCTYKRPQALAALIARLAAQQGPPRIAELVVSDNDREQSGRAVCEAAQAPFPVRYHVEPVQNIARSRNRCVNNASGEWLAFLDDDELPEADWLQRLAQTAQRYAADGVLAPVLSLPPPEAPAWIRRGDFYGRRRFATGTEVPRNELRIGNALLMARWLREEDGPFDESFGLTGGEDGNLLGRVQARGAELVWCDEAVVVEPVVAARLSLRWLLQRAFRGGSDYARHTLDGRYGAPPTFVRTRLTLISLANLAVAGALALLTLPLGRHRSVHWLRKAAAQLGRINAVFGGRYQEYKA